MGIAEGENGSAGDSGDDFARNHGTGKKVFAAAAFNASFNRRHLVQSQPPKGVKPKAGIV
jgi:hypothetical protein